MFFKLTIAEHEIKTVITERTEIGSHFRFIYLFYLWFNVPINSYCHVGMLMLPPFNGTLPNTGCHDTQNVLEKITTHISKQLRLIDCLT